MTLNLCANVTVGRPSAEISNVDSAQNAIIDGAGEREERDVNILRVREGLYSLLYVWITFLKMLLSEILFVAQRSNSILPNVQDMSPKRLSPKWLVHKHPW